MPTSLLPPTGTLLLNHFRTLPQRRYVTYLLGTVLTTVPLPLSQLSSTLSTVIWNSITSHHHSCLTGPCLFPSTDKPSSYCLLAEKAQLGSWSQFLSQGTCLYVLSSYLSSVTPYSLYATGKSCHIYAHKHPKTLHHSSDPTSGKGP